jgi:MOSC domain-containing protein YiiM
MQLISVNIGRAQAIPNAKKTGITGIYKFPAPGPVLVTRLGLAEDAIIDVDHHGGPDQAVYIYGQEDYAWWSQAVQADLLPGTFGDNLTIAGLESAAFSVGDCLRIGPVVLQVTAARIPCGTLAARMGDPLFVKRFRQAERPGLYCRVLQPGPVQAGDEVVCEPYLGETVTILEVFRDFYNNALDAATLRRHLAAPIASRERIEYEAKLRKLLETP